MLAGLALSACLVSCGSDAEYLGVQGRQWRDLVRSDDPQLAEAGAFGLIRMIEAHPDQARMIRYVLEADALWEIDAGGTPESAVLSICDDLPVAVVQELEKRLSRSSPLVQSRVWTMIASMGDRGTPFLIDALQGANFFHRVAAANELSRLPVTPPAAEDALLSAAWIERELLAGPAMLALGGLEEPQTGTTRALLGWLGAEEAWRREAVVEALGRLASRRDDVREALADLARGSGDRIAESATAALEASGWY